ncbi:gas vesicle protein GvpJ [Marinobacter gelidimuriae]|uniref:gas vesicle protein GvpJ n=1 Tax=Marinobacter gelidimuriae TaxID=2739064 RepID=UPI0003781344|nr:gas vesicle protein GvpJ [Marinobacter gelidimuriae]
MNKPVSYSDSMSLCETLDRVLNTGVVVVGEIVISVADIDLIYLGLNLTLTSVETANEAKLKRALEGQA